MLTKSDLIFIILPMAIQCVAFREGEIYIARVVEHEVSSKGDDMLQAQRGLTDRVEAISKRPLTFTPDFETQTLISLPEDIKRRSFRERISLRIRAQLASEQAHWTIR